MCSQVLADTFFLVDHYSGPLTHYNGPFSSGMNHYNGYSCWRIRCRYDGVRAVKAVTTSLDTAVFVVVSLIVTTVMSLRMSLVL